MTTELAVFPHSSLPPWTRAEPEEPPKLWPQPAGKLTLAREDLVFLGTAADRLYIEITLRNAGSTPSEPTIARISTAPIGAFVPWQPLLELPVGAIPPRGTTTLRAEVERSRLGPVPEAPRLSPTMRLVLRSQGVHVSRREPHVYWAGNLDVFVHDHGVERHVARCSGLVPGAMNVADFVVGGARADAYMFDLTGELEGAKISLRSPGLRRRRSIPLSSWIEFPCQQMVWLLAKTSPRHPEGHLQIHVRQRSSGREAIVEFGFGT